MKFVKFVKFTRKDASVRDLCASVRKLTTCNLQTLVNDI